MKSGALSRRDLEGAFFCIACRCLGLDYETDEHASEEQKVAAQKAQGQVRVSWPTGAASRSNPGWERDEDICFLRIVTGRDPYTRLSESKYDLLPDNTAHETVMFTRSHMVSFICYGPNAHDRADLIRTAIVSDAVRAFMSENYDLHPLPHIDEAISNDELDGGEWWGRADLTVNFYEGASRTFAAEIIETAPNIITKGE